MPSSFIIHPAYFVPGVGVGVEAKNLVRDSTPIKTTYNTIQMNKCRISFTTRTLLTCHDDSVVERNTADAIDCFRKITNSSPWRVNWLIHDWDNELRNLGAIQVYPMLSPKSGGRVVKSFTINWTLLHWRLPLKNFSSIGWEMSKLEAIRFLPKNSRDSVGYRAP